MKFVWPFFFPFQGDPNSSHQQHNFFFAEQKYLPSKIKFPIFLIFFKF